MKKTMKMDFNNKTFQDVSVAVMNDVFNSGASGTDMDDLYKAACRYVKITRRQFEELFNQANQKLAEWKNEGFLDKKELSEEDLEMVSGGSVGSFFSAIGNGLATAAKAVGNFVAEYGVVVGLIAGAVACVAGLACMAFLLPIGVPLLAGGACLLVGSLVLDNYLDKRKNNY